MHLFFKTLKTCSCFGVRLLLGNYGTKINCVSFTISRGVDERQEALFISLVS